MASNVAFTSAHVDTEQVDFDGSRGLLSIMENDDCVEDHGELEESMEKSALQMQLWALRQIIKQDATEAFSATDDIHKM